MELFVQIFAFCFLTGCLNSVDELSQHSIQMHLVCCLWNAVIISTPSLWVQLYINPWWQNHIFPDILSIWLEWSKTCPLHTMLNLPIEPQYLSVLTSSVEHWESLKIYPKFPKDLLADLFCGYFSLSCTRWLKYLYIYMSWLGKTAKSLFIFLFFYFLLFS